MTVLSHGQFIDLLPDIHTARYVGSDVLQVLGKPWTRRYIYNQKQCGRCKGVRFRHTEGLHNVNE